MVVFILYNDVDCSSSTVYHIFISAHIICSQLSMIDDSWRRRLISFSLQYSIQSHLRRHGITEHDTVLKGANYVSEAHPGWQNGGPGYKGGEGGSMRKYGGMKTRGPGYQGGEGGWPKGPGGGPKGPGYGRYGPRSYHNNAGMSMLCLYLLSVLVHVSYISNLIYQSFVSVISRLATPSYSLSSSSL